MRGAQTAELCKGELNIMLFRGAVVVAPRVPAEHNRLDRECAFLADGTEPSYCTRRPVSYAFSHRAEPGQDASGQIMGFPDAFCGYQVTCTGQASVNRGVSAVLTAAFVVERSEANAKTLYVPTQNHNRKRFFFPAGSTSLYFKS